ncbi:MAG: PDZ domain-containing protein [Gemmatimonas sp.]
MQTIVARAALFATALSATSLQVVHAQDTKSKERSTPGIRIEPGRASVIWTSSADRAVLGVTMSSSSRVDTAGVRIDDVDTNGPAAKAGLKAGDVITEINGVSLLVTAADAADLALAGVPQRRLQRAMAKAKPGDEVELRVRSSGNSRSVKVRTVSAADLDGSRASAVSRARTDDRDQHGAIGVSIGGSGTVRDTLGLFVSSVVAGGPAEKAGVIEGERIAAVNGVDVRVPKEDVEDMTSASARVNRFVREVQKTAPGGSVSLRVYSNGRYRDVSLKAVKSSELPSSGWEMSAGDGGVRIIRGGTGVPQGLERMPQVWTVPPGASFPRQFQGRIRLNGEELDLNSDALDGMMKRLRERMEESGVRVRGSRAGE